MLVLGKDGQAVDVLDRHHRLVEPALVPGLRRALLALHRIGVDVVAREAVFGRDQIGRDALRHEIGGHRHRGIHRPGAAGRADADAAHRFRAAADHELMLAGHDLGRGEVHGIEAGGAEAADLHARHLLAEAGVQRRETGDVGPGLADWIDHAEHHVVDGILRQIVALLERLQRHRGERQRGDLVERAIGLAAAARGTNVIVDVCLRHDALLDMRIIIYTEGSAAAALRRQLFRTLPRPVPSWWRCRSGSWPDARRSPAAAAP